MGCVGSTERDAKPTLALGRDEGGIIIGSNAAFAKKLDPKDFMLVNRSGEVIVKPPGSVAGEQFVISDCVDCDIFVCDHCEMVTIDRCKQCRIFIGPCESSVFVRNCHSVKLIAACRQFRTRDCEELDVLMHCVSQPSIETSRNVRFGCYQYFYFALAAQFERAHLSVFNNRWSEVYNFNPSYGSATFLEGDAALPTAFLKPLHEVSNVFSPDESDGWRAQSTVPKTLGPAAASAGSCVLVCAPSLGTAGALDLASQLAAVGLPLARALEFETDAAGWRQKLEGALERVPGGGGLGPIPAKARVVVLQVAGEGSPATAAQVVDAFNSARGHTLACAAPDAGASAEMAATLFAQEDAGHALS